MMRMGFAPGKGAKHPKSAFLRGTRCPASSLRFCSKESSWLVTEELQTLGLPPESSLTGGVFPLSSGLPHREQAAEPPPSPGEERTLSAEAGRHVLSESQGAEWP